MGSVRLPAPVRFFASVIFVDDQTLAPARERLLGLLGPVSLATSAEAFDYTGYYGDEMGEGLVRTFFLFERLGQREKLPEIKAATNEIELSLSNGKGRTVNIDPGYLSLENMVLATTKGYAHRIYLGNGIYGDLTLTYQNSSYRPLPWTYPDYGSDRYVTMFNEWREAYKRKLKD